MSNLQKTDFDFYLSKKFFCDLQARDMINVSSKMESTHQIVAISHFPCGLERAAMQKRGSEPFSFAFFENQDFSILV